MKYIKFTKICECIECNCSDISACQSGCYWVSVDRNLGVGICSNCVDDLVAQGITVKNAVNNEPKQ